MAVKCAIASKYRNAGQTSVCANRILVQDGVYDAFTRRLIPLRRLGRAEDIAAVATFLVSPRGGYVTRATLQIFRSMAGCCAACGSAKLATGLQ